MICLLMSDMKISSLWFIVTLLGICEKQIESAVVPPPWSDPYSNPCATQPGGWQLLYWPPLKKCFKIFTLGYPCPDTMELSPVGSSATQKSTTTTAECRCPPGTAQSKITSKCHNLFERAPCDLGQFFAPISEPLTKGSTPKKRFGYCKTPEKCYNSMVYWPHDGKLLAIGKDKLTECLCKNEGDLAQYFYSADSTCHEHFTKGPCEGIGQLYLPGGKCGCHVKLPHYHEETDQCYEIGTIGPCPMGHIFQIGESNESGKVAKASCQCKEGYVVWKNGYCYRMYTRGPCEDGEFLLNSKDCLKNPCGKGRLYFPEEKTCYRIGTQGPCNWQQVVVFDFTTRPSVEGISYNGVCGCTGIISNLDQQCTGDRTEESACESTTGMVEVNGQCYELYSRGPCGPGQWLERRKIVSRIDRRGAVCQCRPGYTQYDSDDGIVGCYAPSVGIARWFLQLIGYDNGNSKFDE
ncbi:hypothetical protein Bhyg_07865 [Pseudolycoriella hygida]|uniref:DUF4789 domain-containing protein n=1 Tax=Pseudolycoriella hygida TaxID=35572 RepID=A0A9Q0N5A9_9DIPT|nr:hypothetical protein Bhyg_07865 [Pseudolycoriella hygida]